MANKRNTFLSTGLALGIAALSLTALLLTLLATQPVLADAGDIAFQGFEGSDSWNYSNYPATYNISSDVWDIVTSLSSINPNSGSNFWGMRDLENPNGGGAFAHTLTFTDTNISGYSAVELSFMYNVLGYDTGDYIEYEVYFNDIGQGTISLFTGTGGTSTSGWEKETVTVPNGTITVSLVLSATQNGGSDYAGYDDIRLTSIPPSYSIDKSAAGQVAPGEVFTYTLTIENKTGITPTTTTITDVLPTGVDFIAASDGGTETGGTVTWSVSNFADGATISRTFMVTATGSHGDAIKNVNYYINGGADWLTTTTGVTVTTQIVDCSDIYGIQYPGGDSLCKGETVAITGVVYAIYGSNSFAIADASGPWHGLYVYDSSVPMPTISDTLLITGTVDEYFNLTQLKNITYTVLNTGTTPYTASVVTSGDINISSSNAESYEGVLVEVHDSTVTDDNLGNGEWSVDDGSGDVRVDDMGSYTYSPTNGDALAVVRGMLYYSYSNYKIEPRDNGDISGLLISKDALSLVAPGALFTYTLTVENYTGATLNDVVITDTVPTSTTFAYALDSGVENNDVVSWTIAALPHTQSITVQFAVTATTEEVVIYNDDYVVSAAGIVTPTRGATVITAVGDGLSIHHIQGNGAVSPLEGQTVEDIEGVVTAVHAKGFYMQEPDADSNPETSEGIYVYTSSAPTVNVGDLAEVDGEVDEYYEMTQLGYVTVITLSSGHTITATEVTLPLVQADDYEAYEGMLVTFPQKLTVNDVYDLGRYGSATLAQGGRLFNPTNVITPGTDANNLQAANDLRKLVLDDGSSDQNPDPIPYPSPALSATNTLRSGDAVTDVTGVLSYQYGEYKLHPTSTPNFVAENARPAAPAAVGGTLKVASFNVLNYFDTFAGCTGGVGGASMDCRGADNTEEFDRQRAKIIDAILDINADIVGLMEIENDGYGDESSAIDDLVDGLNAIAGAGTYAYIDADTGASGTNVLGTDAIKVGLLYKPGTVILTGTTAALNDSTAISGTNFYDMKNRPVLAQSFQEQATGEIVTILVNHLKSKGSDCDDAPYNDPDTGDGQGNCNLTRQAATEAMLAWLATDPTGVADADYLIIGDLNAYAMEDPIMTLQDGGFTNLLSSYIGAEAYSYIFYGQAGYLDHALASPTLLSQIADAAIWHINADEPKVLDYNTEYKTAGQIISLYNADPYRASDHDPVVVGLELKPPEYKVYLPLVLRNSP